MFFTHTMVMKRMIRKFLILAGLFFLVVNLHAQKNQESIIFLNRYRSLLLSDSSVNTSKHIPPIERDGRWLDINYSDNQSGLWQLTKHMSRIKSMSLYYASPKSPGYHDTGLKKNLERALSDWIRHRYQSKNWWHNEIGIPQLMRDILVLVKDSLEKEQVHHCLEIMNQHRVKGTGANLVWSADIGLHYGALTDDTALMRKCRDTILTVIKITTEEGVQPDYSFHQHGKRLQMYHYGGAFLVDDVRLAWQLRGLSLAFPPEKISILSSFVLHGWQWMSRGIHTVPGTIDRAASRENGLQSSDIRKLVPLFYEIDPEHINEYKRLLKIQQGKTSLEGYRYFPYSDFTAFHNKNFSFFLKTNSIRSLLTESINEENLSGDLLNSGDCYFISKGNEYYNLMPAWDWDRLPGITNFKSERKNKIVPRSFVGNVSHKTSGLAVMDYLLVKNKQLLKAKKIWASFGNFMVCLVAGLETENITEPAFTIMDQSRWQGKVSTNKNDSLIEGIYKFSKLQWIHHNSFAYFPFMGDSVIVELKKTNAKWSDINRSESAREIEDRVFMPSLIHHSGSSGYVVAFAKTPDEAENLAKNPVWKIYRNDTLCQAVSFTKGNWMAAIYKAGKVSWPGSQIVTNRPCLILFELKKIFASDPLHAGGLLQLTLNGKEYSVILPSDGMTVELISKPGN